MTFNRNEKSSGLWMCLRSLTTLPSFEDWRFCIFQCCGYFRTSSYSRECGSLNFKTEHSKYHLALFLALVETSSCMDRKNCRSHLVPVFHWSGPSTAMQSSLFSLCLTAFNDRSLLILEKTHSIFGSLGTVERSSLSLSWSVPLCAIAPILGLHPRIMWNISVPRGGLWTVGEPWPCRLLSNKRSRFFFSALALSLLIILDLP